MKNEFNTNFREENNNLINFKIIWFEFKNFLKNGG